LDDTLPSEIKEASEKMIGLPEAEDAEVGDQAKTKDESVDEKGPEGILMSLSDVEAEAKSGIAPPPGIKRLAPQDIELREPRTGDGIFRLDSSGNLIESPAAVGVESPDASAVTPATKSTGGRRTPKRKGLPRLL
jgi:hypothetical protein